MIALAQVDRVWTGMAMDDLFDAADTAPSTLEEVAAAVVPPSDANGFSSRTVFGEGPIGAELALVGEQPGDEEDRQGRPFVGPAGKVLDEALRAAGIDRARCYVTNAVKHFKFQDRGKRRLHQTPTMGDIKHYRWWLMRELDIVHPRKIIALGATAASALAGRRVAILKARGPATFESRTGYVTVHPSYVLRQQDDEARAIAFRGLVDDLVRCRDLIQ